MKRISIIVCIISMLLLITGCGREIPRDIAEEDNSNSITATDNTNTSEASASLDAGQTGNIPEENAQLKLWTDNDAYAKAIIEGFVKKYPGVSVMSEVVGLDAINKVSLDGPAGKGADVFFAPHDKLSYGINSGLLLPLEQSIVDELKQMIPEVAIKTVSSDGKVYGFPVAIETIVMFYNKSLVKGEPLATFEEIIEQAKAYNEVKNNKFFFLHDFKSSYGSYCFASAFGFHLFGPDGTDMDNPGFDTPEFVKGLELISKFHEILPVKGQDLTDEFIKYQFKSGQTPYILGGPWDIPSMRAENIPFGLTELPTFDGKKLTPFSGLSIALVSAYTKYPKAAALLAQHMASQEGAEILYKLAGKVTARKDYLQISGLKDDDIMKVFASQFQNTIPMPTGKRMSYYWSIGNTAYELAFDQAMTPEEASVKAMKDWQGLVDSEF